jgi:uncharacterized LabA/DUF88 family protein
MKSAPSFINKGQSAGKSGYQELLTKAEEQYQIAEKMHRLYQENLDFDFYDLYRAQMAEYASLIQQARLVNPLLTELKLKEMLAEIKKLWPEQGNGITPDLVARVALLLDTAAAMGWNPPTPEIPTCSCEVCGNKGHLGVDIVEREFYDRTLERDSTRWECKNIEKCLDRIGR